MTDQPSPIESEAQIERRIDEVISQAAELAKDLKDEIGDPEPAGADRDQKFFESQTASEGSPEMQLAQADAAIAHAAREIGSEAPPPKPTKISLPPRSPKPGSAPLVDTSPPPPQTDKARGDVTSVRKTTGSPVPPGDDSTTTGAAPAAAPSEASNAPRVTQTASPSQLASPFVERLLGLLEAIDRPFAAINSDVRWVLGWIALIFFVGAGSLLFFVIL